MPINIVYGNIFIQFLSRLKLKLTLDLSGVRLSLREIVHGTGQKIYIIVAAIAVSWLRRRDCTGSQTFERKGRSCRVNELPRVSYSGHSRLSRVCYFRNFITEAASRPAAGRLLHAGFFFPRAYINLRVSLSLSFCVRYIRDIERNEVVRCEKIAREFN